VRARKLVARIAIAGALLAALAASPNALQGEPAPGSGGAAGQPGNAPQYDPNLPPLAAPNDAPIYWLYQYTSTLPLVYFKSTGAFCVYLGFDEKGSYIQNQGDGNVYLWNLKANGLTVVADNFKDLPLNILASLKNADQTVQYWLAANDKSHGPAPVPQHGGVASGTAATAGQIYKGPQHDPNLQPLIGMNDAPVYWSYGSGTVPSVSFRGYPYSKDPSNQGDGVYLGFNSNGSLILDQGNLKLYYWKLTDPRTFAGTVTLAVALKSFRDVPLDLLASLENPSSTTTETLEEGGKGPPKPAALPAPRTAQNPDRSGGLFGDNPQKRLPASRLREDRLSKSLEKTQLSAPGFLRLLWRTAPSPSRLTWRGPLSWRMRRKRQALRARGLRWKTEAKPYCLTCRRMARLQEKKSRPRLRRC
jgi:hypothetical protein